jgi:hypothetical protein
LGSGNDIPEALPQQQMLLRAKLPDAETDKTRVAAENIPHAWRLNGADPVPDVEAKA